MTPLCYIIFNRPDLTARSFQCIREYRPSVLFIIADAPRPDRPAEYEATEQARRLTEQIDWPCDVRRLYAESNMGCGRRISSGISQALQEFETAIVLEDDCIPDPSFFTFCETLLNRYRNDQRIMAVSGDNFQAGNSRGVSSYYFSKYPHCWGWATWRRAWQHFNLKIEQWPEFRHAQGLRAHCNSEREIKYWTDVFDRVHAGKVDSWAFPWTLNCWMQNGLTILPNVNLVSNVGFDGTATHTKSKQSFAELPTSRITDPLVYASSVYRDAVADEFTDNIMFSGKCKKKKKLLQRILPFRRSA